MTAISPRLRYPPRLVAWCLAPLAMLGCKSFKEGYDAKFKESFAASFIASCTSAATKNGAPESEMKPFCTCMGTYLVEHNTPTALTQMSANMGSEESKAIVETAKSACNATGR